MQSIADQAAARIADAVPELAGRFGTALQFSDAMARSGLAQVAPAAFLLPVGLRGGEPRDATGLYIQPIERVLGVVLVLRSASDPLGQRIVDDITRMEDGVIGAIAGWTPDDAIGVFQLSRAELVSLSGGCATYQIDFALADELRINPS